MKSAHLSREELKQSKWLLGILLSVIALWTQLSLDLGGRLLPGAGLGLTALLLCFPGLPGRLPGWFWKALTPALVVWIAGDFLVHRGDLLPPLIRMITLLLLVRCLAYRTRREDLQLIMLCLFIVVISGVLTLSLLFALQILLFTPVAMGLLFIINLLAGSPGERLAPAVWRNFRWVGFFRRMMQAMDIRLALMAGGLYAGMVLVSSLIFVVMPRFRFDQAIPFLQLKTQSLTGFRDTIDLGGVTEITEDDRVALRIDAPSRESVPEAPYFRMLALDSYINGQFSLSRSARTHPQVARSFQSSRIDAALAGRVVEEAEAPVPLEAGLWTFYLEGGVSKYLPVLGPFKQMRFTKRQAIETHAGFLVYNIDQPTTSVFSYQVWTMEPAARLAASRLDRITLPGAQPVVAPRSSEVWKTLEYPMTQLAVPVEEADAAWLRQAVAEIRGGAERSAQEFAERAAAWLQDRHAYSLASRVQDRGRDEVVAWMQDGLGGHCEYFAAAFTLLARTAGHPTRVVVGFNGGSWNTVENYFTVRHRNAHAWCEIFDGEGAWIRVDPTPGGLRQEQTGQSAGRRGLEEESGWDAWVDSLRIVWYRRVINFDQESQEELTTQIQSWSKGFKGQWDTAAREAMDRVTEWWNQPWTWERGLRAGALLLAFCLVVVLIEHRRFFLKLLGRTRWGKHLLRERPEPIRREAGRMLRRLQPELDPVGPERDEAEAEAAAREARQDLQRAFAEVQSLRYGDLSNREDSDRILGEARLALRNTARARRRGPNSRRRSARLE